LLPVSIMAALASKVISDWELSLCPTRGLLCSPASERRPVGGRPRRITEQRKREERGTLALKPHSDWAASLALAPPTVLPERVTSPRRRDGAWRLVRECVEGRGEWGRGGGGGGGAGVGAASLLKRRRRRKKASEEDGGVLALDGNLGPTRRRASVGRFFLPAFLSVPQSGRQSVGGGPARPVRREPGRGPRGRGPGRRHRRCFPGCCRRNFLGPGSRLAFGASSWAL
jgi:hypothetical protein